MARNDGVDRTCARHNRLKDGEMGDVQKHNERENESYKNEDIVKERSHLNIHYKKPTGDYAEVFEQMQKDGIIKVRGTKEDTIHYNEIVFDVNSAYFYNHGGYEFAKQFYEDSYKAAIDIVGGEEFIISAVMHADERNRAMSEALGEDVYHYHLHVVFVPVVEKQILWSKRCKDKSLVGTVKETIMQVSDSKKWLSKQAIDEQGKPMFSESGKPILRLSYTALQDDYFNAIRKAGYDDVERGERGSTEEHLSVTQFKVMKEQERLDILESKIEKKEQTLQKIEKKTKAKNEVSNTFNEIEQMGQSTLMGKVQFTQKEAAELKMLAKAGVTAKAEIIDLKRELNLAKKEILLWKGRYEKLKEETKDFVEALKRAPELVKEFIQKALSMKPEKKNLQGKHKDKTVER